MVLVVNFFERINEKSYDEIRSFNKFLSLSENSKSLIQIKFSQYLNIFSSNEWKRLTSKSRIKNNVFFKREDVESLNKFLEIFKSETI